MGSTRRAVIVMSYLLDTCILIDFLRSKPAAIDYIQSLQSRPSLSVVTVTELYSGVRNQREREAIDRLVLNSHIVDLTLSVALQAGDWLLKYRPSHGVGIADAMIAASAHLNGLPIITQNIKHFPMFPSLQRPYPP